MGSHGCIAYAEFENEIIMQAFYKVDDVLRGYVDFKRFVQEIVVCCVKSFAKVYKKCPSAQVVGSP
jgi:hypothetical protein